jgi:hypothetical protein
VVVCEGDLLISERSEGEELEGEELRGGRIDCGMTFLES